MKMMDPDSTAVCWLVSIALVTVAFVGPLGAETSAAQGICQGKTARTPILIDESSEFTAANGVRSGSGTADDPYVISDWCILSEGDADDGINLHATDAHVVVRDNVVVDFDRSNIRVGSHNVTVENNTVKLGNLGIQIRPETRNATVVGNQIENNGRSLKLGDRVGGPGGDPDGFWGNRVIGPNGTFRDNAMVSNGKGPLIAYPLPSSTTFATSNTIDGEPMHVVLGAENRLIDSPSSYVAIQDSSNVTVTGVSLHDQKWIQVRASSDVDVRGVEGTFRYYIDGSTDLRLEDTGGNGATIWRSADVQMRKMDVRLNILDSSDVLIENSTVRGEGLYTELDDSSVQFRNNTIRDVVRLLDRGVNREYKGKVVFTDNTFVGNRFNSIQSWAHNDTMVIRNNTIGATVHFLGVRHDFNLTIENNDFNDGGIKFRGAPGGDQARTVIRGNRITQAGTGLNLLNTAAEIQMKVVENRFANNTKGIHLWAEFTCCPSTSNVEVHRNAFVDNGWGVKNEWQGRIILNATNNYWGAANGPATPVPEDLTLLPQFEESDSMPSRDKLKALSETPADPYIEDPLTGREAWGDGDLVSRMDENDLHETKSDVRFDPFLTSPPPAAPGPG